MHGTITQGMIQLTFYSRKPEADNASTFIFDTGGLTWRAGQYLALVIPDVSPILEQYEHWFSISSAPFQQQIQVTVRESNSPFKRALFSLQPGDTIWAHTVDGDFAWPESQYPIFIAGGIGITPFMSMLRQRQHERLPINAQLYYFNRHQDILFGDELNQIAAKQAGFNAQYLFEKPLSLDPILNLRPKLDNALVFLAGPVPMVDRLGQTLAQLHIPFKQDYYFGYDISNY